MNNIEKALEHAKRASELVGGTFSYLHTSDQARNYGINFDHTIGHLRKAMPKRIDAVNYIIGSPYWDLINKENFIGWPLIDEGNGFNIQDKFVRRKL